MGRRKKNSFAGIAPEDSGGQVGLLNSPDALAAAEKRQAITFLPPEAKQPPAPVPVTPEGNGLWNDNTGKTFRVITTPFFFVDVPELTPPKYDRNPAFLWTGRKMTPLLWQQMLAFFKHTYDTHHAESCCRFLYHAELGWDIVVFPQNMSAGLSVKDELDDKVMALRMNAGWQPFGTAHHHCGAEAFQSSTDRTDELGHPGLHVTVGNLDKTPFTVHHRVTFRGVQFDNVRLDDFVEVPPELAVPEHLRGMVHAKLYGEMLVKQLFGKLSADAVSPPAWNECCRKAVYMGGGCAQNNWYGSQQFQRWDAKAGRWMEDGCTTNPNSSTGRFYGSFNTENDYYDDGETFTRHGRSATAPQQSRDPAGPGVVTVVADGATLPPLSPTAQKRLAQGDVLLRRSLWRGPLDKSVCFANKDVHGLVVSSPLAHQLDLFPATRDAFVLYDRKIGGIVGTGWTEDAAVRDAASHMYFREVGWVCSNIDCGVFHLFPQSQFTEKELEKYQSTELKHFYKFMGIDPETGETPEETAQEMEALAVALERPVLESGNTLPESQLYKEINARQEFLAMKLVSDADIQFFSIQFQGYPIPHIPCRMRVWNEQPEKIQKRILHDRPLWVKILSERVAEIRGNPESGTTIPLKILHRQEQAIRATVIYIHRLWMMGYLPGSQRLKDNELLSKYAPNLDEVNDVPSTLCPIPLPADVVRRKLAEQKAKIEVAEPTVATGV